MDIQYLLSNNHRIPLSHMAESFIFIEETNQHINELSIEYTMNPNFHKNKVFREQVKVFLKTHIFYINHDKYK